MSSFLIGDRMRSLSWDEVAGKTDTVAAEIAGIAAVAIYEMSSA